jgi:spermidine/putrescine transport system substrate-binding protein
MTNDHDGSSIDLEKQLVRYMVERRITRRALLERMAALGATAALAPIIAACTSAATAAPSPTGTPVASPSAAGTASPSAAVATESAPPTPVPVPEKELFVYNWADYIGPDVQKDFEKKYGIKVKYAQFPDGDTQLAKIRSNGKGGGYDITYAYSADIPGLVTDGVLQPVNKSLIPNIANLGAEWADPGYDKGNAHSVPYMWWTTGYAWNPDKIKDDLTSWTALWDDRFAGHINMLDDNREVFAVAAYRLGLGINSTADADLDAELALLKQQKPLVRTYNTDDIGQLTGGQAWITHAWSGDYFQMLTDKPKTKYVVPSEGAVRGSDAMVVLSGAPHPVAANLWIDFNLDAKVSAANSNAIGYMGPNAAAQQFISSDILEDPAVNPAKATLDKLTELLDLGADLKKITDRWLSLKS